MLIGGTSVARNIFQSDSGQSWRYLTGRSIPWRRPTTAMNRLRDSWVNNVVRRFWRRPPRFPNFLAAYTNPCEHLKKKHSRPGYVRRPVHDKTSFINRNLQHLRPWFTFYRTSHLFVHFGGGSPCNVPRDIPRIPWELDNRPGSR